MISPLLRPKRRADILRADLDDDVLLYHPQRMTAVALNPAAFSIWQMCDGERTIAHIIKLLQAAYPEESERMPAQVETSLRSLSRNGVLLLPRVGPAAATFDVELGGATVRLEADDAAAAKVVEFLCGAMAEPEPSTEAPVTLRLGPGIEPSSMAVYRDDALLYQNPSVGGAAAILLERLQDHLIQQCTGGILLHAAAMARGERSLLLAGRTGSGKTTLATWLLRQGFEYLTDELLWVDASGNRMRGFSRPLHLKADGGALFEDLLAPPGKQGVAETPHGHHLSPLHLAAGVRREARPDVLVFPTYSPGSRLVLRPLEKAQAATRLMGCLVNARSRTAHGFEDVVRLVRDVSPYALTYSDLDEGGPQLAALLAE